MRQLIAGNWKMNGTIAQAASLVDALRRGAPGCANCDIVVFPPATALNAVAHMLVGSSIEVGGQDCHAEMQGAHTGDISAKMLADVGAGWVIVGHSERRTAHGETNAMVRAKASAAIAAGLRPIVCVGESSATREGGEAVAFVRKQLTESLPALFSGVIAYEPIWAVGTGRVAGAAELVPIHQAIRELVGGGVRILYGGSVKPHHAGELLALPDIDGLLVGGASLDAAQFLEIAAAAQVARVTTSGLGQTG